MARWTLERAASEGALTVRPGMISSKYNRMIYAVDIAADLRAVFYIEGDTVWTVDIGTHAIYRG